MARTAIQAKKQAPARRRRLPEVAELEILDATEKLLRRLSFHELTVSTVMAETGLARPSFYQYFGDLHQLLARLTDRYITEVIALAAANAEEPDGADIRAVTLRRAPYEQACRLIRKRRHLHRALVDAAPGDPAVARIHRRYMNAVAGLSEAQIRAAQKQGYAKGLDPKETARALQLMGEHYIIEKLVLRSGDIDEVIDTLINIRARVVFGVLPD
jgi:AcrR family transcriptional regulator